MATKLRITSKQKSARRKNIAIARKKKKKGGTGGDPKFPGSRLSKTTYAKGFKKGDKVKIPGGGWGRLT